MYVKKLHSSCIDHFYHINQVAKFFLLQLMIIFDHKVAMEKFEVIQLRLLSLIDFYLTIKEVHL